MPAPTPADIFAFKLMQTSPQWLYDFLTACFQGSVSPLPLLTSQSCPLIELTYAFLRTLDKRGVGLGASPALDAVWEAKGISATARDMDMELIWKDVEVPKKEQDVEIKKLGDRLSKVESQVSLLTFKKSTEPKITRDPELANISSRLSTLGSLLEKLVLQGETKAAVGPFSDVATECTDLDA